MEAIAALPMTDFVAISTMIASASGRKRANSVPPQASLNPDGQSDTCVRAADLN